MQAAERIEILNLVIFSGFQNQGHGKSLLRRIFAVGRQMGAAALWLEVRESNVFARHLYHADGFVEDGIRKDYYPCCGSCPDEDHNNRRETAILMHRQID